MIFGLDDLADRDALACKEVEALAVLDKAPRVDELTIEHAALADHIGLPVRAQGSHRDRPGSSVTARRQVRRHIKPPRLVILRWLTSVNGCFRWWLRLAD